ncbi:MULTISPECIES: hypothetical protein [unclassified Variovorax]|jgi:hypothetical protein|uniref:hypothetical protein n=1 Tax=unclassified Variovorax TaxID=663243 RepID=UPI0008C423D7|nr:MULTISPECIES: hypothetical protein [unclassified Variovorax]SEJ95607.1 hypothetical protein SAMN05518853_105124 [Variovorax sp. OK202]SFD19461.1 hypothetical protein SAMN05444746_105164 [Variovorax sp. OK212]
MFGALTFGASTFGAKPFSGALVIEVAGLLAAGAGVEGLGAGRASSGGLIEMSADARAGLVALRSAAATATQGAVLEAQSSIVSNVSGLVSQSAPLMGMGSAVVSSEGRVEASADFLGYRLRAYDQLFPANVANGDVVQIGARLYEWRANAGRWRPAGPAP